MILRSDVERKALFGLRRDSTVCRPKAMRPRSRPRIYASARREGRPRALRRDIPRSSMPCSHARPSATRSPPWRGKASVTFRGLFLTADLETRMARVGKRERDASDATPDIARQQESYDLGSLDWTCIDASGTPDDTLTRAKALFHDA